MSAPAPPDRPQSGSDGFIIVAVLWILAALATLVSVYAIYVTNSAIAVAASGDAIIADPLVSAGVELAAYQLIGAKKEDRPAVGNFTARVGTARLTVAFQTACCRKSSNSGSTFPAMADTSPPSLCACQIQAKYTTKPSTPKSSSN